MKQPTPQRFRRDSWTPQRQLAFLDTLARTRSVTKAARAAGMSRESAYRLRARDSNGLFAALWDAALSPPRAPGADFSEGHISALADGSLARLLGAHFRRERGDFLAIGFAGERRGQVIGRERCDPSKRCTALPPSNTAAARL